MDDAVESAYEQFLFRTPPKVCWRSAADGVDSELAAGSPVLLSTSSTSSSLPISLSLSLSLSPSISLFLARRGMT